MSRGLPPQSTFGTYAITIQYTQNWKTPVGAKNVIAAIQTALELPLSWAAELDNNPLVWIITNVSQVENSVFNNYNKYVEKFPFL
jgi:hypothetical protein